MTRKSFAVLVLGGTALAVVSLYLAVGSMLTAPSHHPVRAAPERLNPENIVLVSPSGARLAAWVLLPSSPRGAVVLVHGVRADRSDMLSRARLLWDAGYAVLVPDLQGHGESTGDRITFGSLEARDVEGCLRYTRDRFPHLRVGAVGVSLGGAAVVLAAGHAQPDAAVLEAVFPTIAEAVDNRLAMRVGGLSRVLGPLLLLQLRPRLGFGPEELRPVEAIRKLRCPVLVMGGSVDRHTTEAQTRALFAAASEPKELWLVDGADHDDLLRYDRDTYQLRVLRFLKHHLLDVS